jgi:magnesium transporter
MNHAPAQSFSPETAGDLMYTKIPTAYTSDSVKDIMGNLAKNTYDDIDFIYVISENGKLQGEIPIEKLVASTSTTKLKELVVPCKTTVHPHADQEKVVIEAIKHDLEMVPVVDKDEKFLGAVTAEQLIDILHMEHLEDFLVSSGIRGRGSHILNLASGNVLASVKARAPWLIIGLLIGLGLGLITKQFEDALQKNIALVYFVPVIAYIAASAGTQTEAIFVRSVAILKLNIIDYLLKETVTGMLLGLVLGIVGGIGALLISQSHQVAGAVGIAIFLAITVAALLACIIPIVLKSLGRDPALGGGPLATVFQDMISILIYFSIASVLVT